MEEWIEGSKLRITLVGREEEKSSDDFFDDHVADVGSSSSASSRPSRNHVPQELLDKFSCDGFAVFPNALSREAVDMLNDRLEDILRGRYDRGNKPDKVPKLIKLEKPLTRFEDHQEGGRKVHRASGPIGFSGNLQNVKVLQIINVHKADSIFRELVTSPELGEMVATLAGWEQGARLAQDQVWAKPPGAAPLVFHRDSPYFMFEPSDVVTVWIALDDMDRELGPLEYVRGSHKWSDGRVGTSNQFYQDNAMGLVKSAARREGLDPDGLEIASMAGLCAGGLSIHHGKVWHGSSKNRSTCRPRRGIGLHFVPTDVRFTEDARHSVLWRPYVENGNTELPDEDFPITWTPSRPET